MNEPKVFQARYATLKVLRAELLPLFFNPVPSKEAVRALFDRAKVPRIKANPQARNGGGEIYYQVAAIEKLMRTKALPPLRPQRARKAPRTETTPAANSTQA